MAETEYSRQTEILTIEPMVEIRQSKDTTSITFVSLYLLLLAFFIFLHSISVFKEDRVRSVLGSVEIAFQGLSRDIPAERQMKLSGEEQGIHAFHARLKNVFETAIPLVETETTEMGARLQFSVPLTQLFKGSSAKVRDGFEPFLDDVAALLIARNNDMSTDMEIMIGTGLALPNPAATGRDLASERLNALIRRFSHQGVPARNLSIGMEASDAGLVHFSFFPRKGLGYQFRKTGERS
ncbi:hypothetical protein [Sneathiella sp.]|uniref:hypothetical protein n=1 Tax=Sneathiella sp. TaxID=1964365 RepID=UPI002FE134C3